MLGVHPMPFRCWTMFELFSVVWSSSTQAGADRCGAASVSEPLSSCVGDLTHGPIVGVSSIGLVSVHAGVLGFYLRHGSYVFSALDQFRVICGGVVTARAGWEASHGVLAVGRGRRDGVETFLVGSLGGRFVRTRGVGGDKRPGRGVQLGGRGT